MDTRLLGLGVQRQWYTLKKSTLIGSHPCGLVLHALKISTLIGTPCWTHVVHAKRKILAYCGSCLKPSHTHLIAIHANFLDGNISNFQIAMPRLSIKYASVEVLGSVSNMPRSIPNMPRLGPPEAYLKAIPTFIIRLLIRLAVLQVKVLHFLCFRSVFRNESTITSGAYSSTLKKIHAYWLSAMRPSRTRFRKKI